MTPEEFEALNAQYAAAAEKACGEALGATRRYEEACWTALQHRLAWREQQAKEAACAPQTAKPTSTSSVSSARTT